MIMIRKKEIKDIDDIKLLVNSFYRKVRNDSFLSPILNGHIQDQWPQHLEKMYTFWQTVLLEDHTYFRSPFPPNAGLPIDESHFSHWLALFTKTIEELFYGEKAEEALWRANKMSQMFQMKLDQYRNQKIKSLV
ncbi:group III truncated hemoglobin [soil metagenome]